jgi:hypothetical protein
LKIATVLLVLSLFVSFEYSIFADGVEILPAQSVTSGTEIIALRSANSKTFDLGGGKYRVEISSATVHYKNDYQSKAEEWKDIDTTFNRDGKVITAPYDLTISGLTITVKCKQSGSISSLTLSKIGSSPPGTVKPAYALEGNKASFANIALDTDLEIVAENERVKFTRVLKTDKAPLDADFLVEQYGEGPIIYYSAMDADGDPVRVTTVKDGNIVSEVIREADLQMTGHAGETKTAKYPIRIDPTWQVGASTDDARRRITPSNWSLTSTMIEAGRYSVDGSIIKFGCGMRFTNVTIPKAATITAAHLTLRNFFAFELDSETVNTRISAEDVDDAVTFADNAAAFDTRYAARTTARVNYAPGHWLASSDYNSADISTVIQEVIDRNGWATGNAIVIFWEDYDNRSTGFNSYRGALSYDGSTNYAPKLVVTYTAPCTVVTLGASLASYTTARLNGNVTVGEAADVTITFFWGDNNGNVTAGNWDFTGAPTSPAQPQGVGTCYKDVDSLHFNTLYWFNVRGVSSGSTSWGTSGNFTTLDILDCGLATFTGSEGVCGNTLSWSFEYSNSTIEIQAMFADCEPFLLYEGNSTSYFHNLPELLEPVAYHAQVNVNNVALDETCDLSIGGEAIEAINETFGIWLALGLALGLSFLSLKAGAYMWFVSCWPWVALATLVSITWLQGVAILMAVVCLGLFVVGISGKSRGR